MRVHIKKSPWVLLAVFCYGSFEILRDIPSAPVWLSVTAKVLAGGIAATGLIKARSESQDGK